MRIGYDARCLAGGHRTGIGQYAYHLIGALAGLRAPHRMQLLFPRGSGGPVVGGVETVKTIVPPHLREDRFFRLWYDLYLPARIRLGRIDLFHGPGYLCPSSRRARLVVTVHDLAHELFPELAIGCSPEFARRARLSVERADAVIAVSATTRGDIIERYGKEEAAVRVIREGVSPRFRRIGDRGRLEAFRAARRLPRSFVLSVASLHPRKNLDGLLRAFSLMKRSAGPPHHLVVSGKVYGDETIRKRAAKLGIADSFSFLGYVPHEELPLLYNLADAFVFPSIYEGFGLPPLEAMACGAPVASSSAGSLPEVLGGAAVYFDPLDTEEMASRIAGLLESEKERERLRRLGAEQAKRYDWTDAARETMRLYEELA